MKILIDRKTFGQALAEVAPFAPTKAPIAILKNAKITTKGNRMKIEANDTQCAMVKYIEVMECDSDGSFLIDIADLNKFIQKVKGNTIELDVKENTLHLKHSNGTAEFQTEDAADFPAFNIPDGDTTELTISTSMLSEAIAKGKGFVSTDTLRPQMCSIYTYVKDGEFGFCATDTSKLIHGHNQCIAEIKSADVNADDVHWFITPSVFSALSSICKNADMVNIRLTDKRAMYRVNSTVIHTTMPNGKYPDFKRVIPQTWNMECVVDKAEFTDALSRVALLCDNSQCVKLDITPMDMTVSVDNLEYMKSAKDILSHEGCGGNIKIGVNVGNAMTSVGALGTGTILMRMTDASRPILFTNMGNENLQVISMPMVLNS